MADSVDAMFKAAAEQGKLSAFNMAQLDLYRIHVLLSDCNTYSRDGNLVLWKRTLDALSRELHPHFEGKEEAGYNVCIVNVVPALKIFIQNRAKPKIKAGLRLLSDDSAYTFLAEYEVVLRKVMKRMGINLPSRGVRSAIGGGE